MHTMENHNCERHSKTRNEINLLTEDNSMLNGGCHICIRSATCNPTQTGPLFNIEDVNWQMEKNGKLPNKVFLTSSGAESRLSLNSTDSVDAPLLLNEYYNEFDDMDEFHCHNNNLQIRDNKALRKLLAASCLCLFFMITEIVGGYLANSLSVMTDAAHLLSDFIGFLISLFSIWLGGRACTQRMSFGFHRAEVLGALFSIVVVWLLTGIFMYLAVYRLVHEKYDIDADTMMLVSAIGVFINIIMGITLHGSCTGLNHNHSHSQHGHSQGTVKSSSDHHTNINVRAAVIHVLGDLIQSIGVFIASVIIKFNPSAKMADPICTFVFSIIVILTTKNVLRDTLNVLMEAVPLDIDYLCVSDALRNIEGVVHVHDLRIWSLTLNKKALSVHLAVDKTSDKEEILITATRLVRTKFGISTVTIQQEKFKEEVIGSCLECKFPRE